MPYCKLYSTEEIMELTCTALGITYWRAEIIIIIITTTTTEFTTEIQRMWHVKTNVIRVIIGATGTISKSFRKYLSNMTVKHDIKELQKTAILDTAHTLRKVR
jgi:hypothetical protein